MSPIAELAQLEALGHLIRERRRNQQAINRLVRRMRDQGFTITQLAVLLREPVDSLEARLTEQDNHNQPEAQNGKTRN